MGKRYFCDYCERSFADGAENRKKHLASMNHQKVRKAHYDMFKGDCEFGNNCKYSHLTPAIIQQLEEEAHAEKSRPCHAKSNIEAEIDAWIESKACKLKEDKSASSTVSNSTLPAVLANIPNLPPSLVPCTILDAYHAQRKNDQEWG